MPRSGSITTAAVICAAILLGCAESDPPATSDKPGRTKPVTQAAVSPAVVTAPAGPGEPAVPPPPVEEFTYNPSGRRDPFRSLIVTGGKRSVDLLPPLQRREVSELKFVAVVWGQLGTYGMLEMPDGKGYAVRIGTRVGPNRGVVKRITARDLTVAEQYVDFFGETRTRDIVLDLRTREEGLE